MILADLIRKSKAKGFATAIPAIRATPKADIAPLTLLRGPDVAEIAEIAVANAQPQIAVMPLHDRRPAPIASTEQTEPGTVTCASCGDLIHDQTCLTRDPDYPKRPSIEIHRHCHWHRWAIDYGDGKLVDTLVAPSMTMDEVVSKQRGAIAARALGEPIRPSPPMAKVLVEEAECGL